MKELVFITGNQHKADFLAKHIGIPLEHHKLDLTEVQSLDLHEIVEHKAREAYKILGNPVLVEDASLSFDALGRLPGPYIKWFIEEIGYDGLLDLANRLPDQAAHGRVCYGLYSGTELQLFDGEMHGRIAKVAGTGSRGFGFDRIFINEGFEAPRSDMSEADYARTSYRTMGIEKLRAYLTKR
jgi:inosine triphosphate pyrophosphatase